MSILHRMGPLDKAVMERLTISLPSEQRAEVARIAAEHDASEAAVIRAALERGLPELNRHLVAEAARGPSFDYSQKGPITQLSPRMMEKYESEADASANGTPAPNAESAPVSGEVIASGSATGAIE